MLIMQLTHVKCGMHTWVSHGKGVEHECSGGRVQAGKVTKQSVVDTMVHCGELEATFQKSSNYLAFPGSFHPQRWADYFTFLQRSPLSRVVCRISNCLNGHV